MEVVEPTSQAKLGTQGGALMRWFFGILVLSGCGGDGGPTPDAVFDVKITNTLADCGERTSTTTTARSQTGLTNALSAIWWDSQDIPTDFCSCTDETDGTDDSDTDGTDDSDDALTCFDDIKQGKESVSYEVFRDGALMSIRIDGETFATGSTPSLEAPSGSAGCSIEYESPVWLESTDGGEVQWQVQSVNAMLDMNGACSSAFEGGAAVDYDFLGIERIEIVGSTDKDAYPVGRTVWKIVAGTRQGG
jgi:hypothetical protein